MTKQSRKKRILREITDYDQLDTTDSINEQAPIHLEDLGFILPKVPPTQVVSIRFPSELLNELRAIGSEQDVPYQAVIKMMLAERVREWKRKKKRAA